MKNKTFHFRIPDWMKSAIDRQVRVVYRDTGFRITVSKYLVSVIESHLKDLIKNKGENK